MAETKNPDILEKPGDYNLKEVVIVNSHGERADIKAFILELNLFILSNMKEKSLLINSKI